MRGKSILGMVFIAVFLLAVTTTAFSAGYPVLAAVDPVSPDDPAIVVVGKFDQGAFTEAQADQLSDAVAGLIGSLGLTQGTPLVLKPSQLRIQFGATDADALKSVAKIAYQGAGFDLYIFLDVTKKASVSAEYGSNIKIDVWVADLAALLGFSGDYLYVATLETPEMITSFLSLL